MGRHALLSASSSRRWLNCTPSARLEQQFPADVGSIYAEEGTAAHALAEHKLKRLLKKRSRRRYPIMTVMRWKTVQMNMFLLPWNRLKRRNSPARIRSFSLNSIWTFPGMYQKGLVPGI